MAIVVQSLCEIDINLRVYLKNFIKEIYLFVIFIPDLYKVEQN